MGAQKNRLIETVLLSTHNMCFGWEIKNIIRLITHSYLETCETPQNVESHQDLHW